MTLPWLVHLQFLLRFFTTISHLSKRAREYDASVGKADASVEKPDVYVGKVFVLALKPSLPYLDKKLFGPSPIIEETQDTQDPAVTISGANP